MIINFSWFSKKIPKSVFDYEVKNILGYERGKLHIYQSNINVMYSKGAQFFDIGIGLQCLVIKLSRGE
jgi:hypothetical protein